MVTGVWLFVLVEKNVFLFDPTEDGIFALNPLCVSDEIQHDAFRLQKSEIAKTPAIALKEGYQTFPVFDRDCL
ncbi:hypothetical protein KIN20_005729 [Parelaphostrongylus tenuis]|uniref:Uncharacterized protein n=1 Tax=Parelaphostrongylus tenuis TaxID=148309 RepID=A0AAD5MLX9_PARTN|nr:hypothetical protein KIN20_005729 [Parelaphostrongylus tenuis]